MLSSGLRAWASRSIQDFFGEWKQTTRANLALAKVIAACRLALSPLLSLPNSPHFTEPKPVPCFRHAPTQSASCRGLFSAGEYHPAWRASHERTAAL